MKPCFNSSITAEVTTKEPKELQLLLKKYQGIFMKPKGLPPPRAQDHQIPLLSDSVPPIEWMIKELLAVGSIQRSVSPFSSPIFLVKRKDNT